MTSPAQRHMMRVSASQAAQREQAPLRHATAYEQMLVKLADDRRTLKTIRSNELKAAKKRELLPFYAPWVAGVLADGRGAQDDILMTVMLWRLDAGEPVDLALLLTPLSLTDGADVPDMVRARLHKVTGLTLRDAGQSAEALAQFQRAMQLDRNAGVRKEIERLERALKPKPDAAPRKTTKPRTRKPATKPAAKRGRPPKAVKTAG